MGEGKYISHAADKIHLLEISVKVKDSVVMQAEET